MTSSSPKKTGEISTGLNFQETRQKKINEFNPMEHQAPRYLIDGRVKNTSCIPNKESTNILQKDVRIPEWWSDTKLHKEGEKHIAPKAEGKTQAQIKAERKMECVPHPSYDLDGDGIVDHKDYFLAKRFDLDRDGRLNTAEKNAAVKALQSGYENQFFWKVEETGAQRGARLLQVRGQFVDAEDFLPVSKTYPPHPLSEVPVQLKTAAELKAKRKEETMATLQQAKIDWDKAHPSSVPQRFILSEYLVDNPTHISTSQIKAEKQIAARIKDGLTIHATDLKDCTKSPGLEFIRDPSIKTKTDLAQSVKAGNLRDLSKFGQNRHIGETERLKGREDCILRQAHQSKERITQDQIAAQRKKEMVDYNIKTFGNIAIGIHGKELPKFSHSQSVKQYWKLNDHFSASPQHQSRLELKQTQKYWAKPDEMLLSDVRELQAPTDPFKLTHFPKETKMNVCEKVNLINHFNEEAEDPYYRKTAGPMQSRWTEVVQYFSQKRSAYEEDPNMRQSLLKFEQLPLPSSFSKDGQFRDPLDKLRSTVKPRTSETKMGVQSSKAMRGTKEQLKPPKENLLLRVTSKKSISPPEVDMRRTMTAGIRTGGFSIN